MSLLNVGARALLANQAALQTVGHNIANVNTEGYSRQTVVLETAGSQYSGGGYIGRGVNVANVVRQHSDFLTRQSTLANAVSAADTTRANSLGQLENVFPGGKAGLGAAVTDMLNAFSDVASAPTDLTARSVVLTRAQELAGRFTGASSQLDQLKTGVEQQLSDDVSAVNGLIGRIAAVNQQIANASGRNIVPNDLLDQRDLLINNLNRYVQTTQVAADDGAVNVFVGSQPVVLGISTATVSVVADPSGDPDKLKLAVGRSGGAISTFDEAAIGGGEMAGLLRFHNTDLAEGRNLLGRLALGTASTVNAQHRLGIDLDGNPGTDLFKPPTLPAGFAAASNTGTGSVALALSDASQLAASDYQVQFSSATTGTVVRLSDGTATAFDTTVAQPVVDGLAFTLGAGAASGDSFVVKPFSAAAAAMATTFSSPRQLAVGSPVVASAAQDNQGTVAIQSLKATTQNAALLDDAVLTFNSPPTSYTISSPSGTVTGSYATGATIAFNGWELTLKGAPKAGDVVVVQGNDSTIRTPLRDPAAWPGTPGATPVSVIGGPVKTTAGNADALAALRDVPLYDGAPMSDGYAALMSQLGTRVQSAQFTAKVSDSIAASLKSDVGALAGVNLDEEASKLLQYQQAYQASAKMVQIAQNIFDSVIQALGR